MIKVKIHLKRSKKFFSMRNKKKKKKAKHKMPKIFLSIINLIYCSDKFHNSMKTRELAHTQTGAHCILTHFFSNVVDQSRYISDI